MTGCKNNVVELDVGIPHRDASAHGSHQDQSHGMRAGRSWYRDLAQCAVATPLGSLVITLLVTLLGGLFVHTRVYAMTGGLLAIIFVGLAWPWFSVWFVRGALTFLDTRGREGKPTTLRLTLRSRSFLCVHGLQMVWRHTESGAPSDFASIETLARLPAGKSVVLDHPFTPSRRGEYPLGEVYVTCRLPFGLWTARRRMTIENRLLVWPATHRVGPIPEAAGRPEHTALCLRGRAGTQGDFVGIRPYRRGDSLRRVHWGQTARYERLIVCELEAATIPAVRVVLDVDPSGYPGREGLTWFEDAVREAASLCTQWLLDGATVELVAGRHVVPARAGRLQVTTILDVLAKVTQSAEPFPPLPGGDLFEVRVTSDRSTMPRAIRSAGRALWVRVPSDQGVTYDGEGGNGTPARRRNGFAPTGPTGPVESAPRVGRASC